MNSSAPEFTIELLYSSWKQLFTEGQQISYADLCRDCPHLLPGLFQRIQREHPDAIEELSRLKMATETLDAVKPAPRAEEASLPRDNPSTLTQNPGERGPSGFHLTVTHTPEIASNRPSSMPRIPGFEVVSYLGGGGMGEVYKVKKIGFNITYALKIIRRDRMRPQIVERFRMEAEAMTKLDHPHIVRVFEVGEGDDQNPYLTMRLLSGETLAKRMREWQGNIPKSIAIMKQICSAVAYLHKRGLLHRDIKPGNVLFDEHDNPYLSDFGLVKDTQQQAAAAALIGEHSNDPVEEKSAGLTHANTVMGTPEYMSPEQRAADHQRIGPPADVYSLGVMLYELAVGQRPSTGSGFTIVAEGREAEAIPPINECPIADPALRQIILKCLAANPDERYSNAIELAAILAEWTQPEHHTQSRWWKRPRLVAAMGVALLAAATAGVMLSRSHEDNPKNAPAKPDTELVDFDNVQTGIWQPIPLKSPTVIRWSEEGPTSRKIYNPETGDIQLANEKTGLLSFGETKASHYRLRLDFLQTPLEGHVGLFFGYRAVSNENAQREFYQVVWLIPEGTDGKGRSMRAQWNACQDNSGGPSMNFSLTSSQSFPLSFPLARGEHRLEIEVGARGIESVFWKEEMLKGMNASLVTETRPTRYNQGQFGIFVSTGSCVVRSLSYQVHGE